MEKAIEYLRGEGFKPDGRMLNYRRFRRGDHFATVGRGSVEFYTPGINGEEGFTQNIKASDLGVLKVVVESIKEEGKRTRKAVQR